jgi:hypothetical protein
MAYNGLPAFVDVDVFDGDFLLTLASVAVKRFEEHGIGAAKLVCLSKVLAPAIEGLFGEHGLATVEIKFFTPNVIR